VRTNRARTATVLILVATVVQLGVAAAVPDLPQFEGKGFAARLALYPAMMLLVPAAWWVVRWWRGRSRPDAAPAGAPAPWDGFALLMTPFLVDVTGNTVNLYDRVVWWDDANHLVNWFLLCLGLGLVLLPGVVAPRWVLAGLVAGGGALLAVVWELGEWYTFIRHGTELATAYEDTLGDEALGTTGAGLAAVVLLHRRGLARRRAEQRAERP
jgi:hypothetical protein